jgi:hypothetical protein
VRIDSSLLQCLEVIYGTLLQIILKFYFYQHSVKNIKVVPQHTVWTNGGVDLELNLFLTFTLDGGKIELHTPAALTLGRKPPLPMHCATESSYSGSGHFREEIKFFLCRELNYHSSAVQRYSSS